MSELFNDLVTGLNEDNIMENIKLSFLGNEYEIPIDLKKYVGYLQEFEGYYNEIIPLLTNQIESREFTGGAEVDFDYFKIPLLKCGKKIISRLADLKIYDATLDDIVLNNGYVTTNS